MTVIVLLALAAALILLILEGAWLARVPPQKYAKLLLRSVYIGLGLVVIAMVFISSWHWIFLPVGIVLMFGELWHHRVTRNPSLKQHAANARASMNRFAASTRAAVAESTRARPEPHPHPPASPPSDMTPERALKILGLPQNANEQQIKEAHRRLMRRMHPDRGGSSAQAAQINRAKDVLLGN